MPKEINTNVKMWVRVEQIVLNCAVTNTHLAGHKHAAMVKKQAELSE